MFIFYPHLHTTLGICRTLTLEQLFSDQICLPKRARQPGLLIYPSGHLAPPNKFPVCTHIELQTRIVVTTTSYQALEMAIGEVHVLQFHRIHLRATPKTTNWETAIPRYPTAHPFTTRNHSMGVKSGCDLSPSLGHPSLKACDPANHKNAIDCRANPETLKLPTPFSSRKFLVISLTWKTELPKAESNPLMARNWWYNCWSIR